MSHTIQKFIRLKQIAALLNCSQTSATRYAKLNGFPDPFYIGGSKMWVEAEVMAWVMSCRRSRRA
ncbi:hypothetical protein M527_23765 [Sphingobium indicum IP26]|jgi:predicted DNA-binding transcriptional regulator AlpA|uniref:Uncharacterized protein n=1 Tax=Sphingobium indicum F2 TaxID=1450518 RepID=A0A8E0WQ92_9SPHN|nr:MULTISPECIES: AlpA family phage regulatory protein [Sphingobium]EPR15769.1 hypothetical protein M527_23765 [Sphingobium indicum IP26]KER35441.1 hypothetical protein AL00_15860 [Sphingobium indicum F2]MCB4861230.1 AlpA family phage regulatory protein [Sphingobium sp. PNB]UXC90703.1 AlpA family phage regulatory protein [Sphingobium sp. RSMS]